MIRFHHGILWVFSLVLIFSCTTTRVQRELYHTDQINGIDPENHLYVKVHTVDGHVYILKDYRFDLGQKLVTGSGQHLGVNRRVLEDNSKNGSKFSIGYDEIRLLETNDRGGENPGTTIMLIAGVATGGLAAFCIINPKACFGSCPTYYIQKNDSLYLRAEGFSSSISKRLEEEDIDKLADAEVKDGRFDLVVKNEAYETHLIRKVNLRVHQAVSGNIHRTTDDRFFTVHNERPPVEAIGPEGSFYELIQKMDEQERISLSDDKDLTEKEDLYLKFKTGDITNPGLIISARQSLMTTYLFYQSLAFLGRAAGFYYAEMEKDNDMLFNRTMRLYELLGGIEIFYKRGNQWISIEELNEQGPIASDIHLVPIPSVNQEYLEIKIRMSKGLWRINHIALGETGDEIYPAEVEPVRVLSEDGEAPDVLEKLTDHDEYLVTFPGDDYRLVYDLSRFGPNPEIFVDSQGYYIEWMREEWLAEEDLRAARNMLLFPRSFLRRMAPHYKAMESEMEEIFWNSRYVKVD